MSTPIQYTERLTPEEIREKKKQIHFEKMSEQLTTDYKEACRKRLEKEASHKKIIDGLNSQWEVYNALYNSYLENQVPNDNFVIWKSTNPSTFKQIEDEYGYSYVSDLLIQFTNIAFMHEFIKKRFPLDIPKLIFYRQFEYYEYFGATLNQLINLLETRDRIVTKYGKMAKEYAQPSTDLEEYKTK